MSLRILADHSRAAAFLITDGVVPSNEGRGYVLRKILRRAVRHGQLLGQERRLPVYPCRSGRRPHEGQHIPELENSREFVATIVKQEEQRFSTTLSLGTQRLDEICAKATDQGQSVLAGEDLFRLYDTYGFPLDLAQEIAAEKRLPGRHKPASTLRWRNKGSAPAPAGRRSIAKPDPIYQELSEASCRSRNLRVTRTSRGGLRRSWRF